MRARLSCVTETKETEITDTKPTPTEVPTVLTTKGVSLANHLKLDELPLATTPGGKNFVIKSLHPSEHTIKSCRVPGGNMMTTSVCSDVVYTVGLPNDNDVTIIRQTANPLVPVSIEQRTVGGTYITSYDFISGINQNVVVEKPGYASIEGHMQQFVDNGITSYRVVAQSVTAELIAPALKDQGTITAIQREFKPRTVQNGTSNQSTQNCIPDTWVYPEPGVPSALTGTAAYTAKAREGVYQPLKINSFKWKDVQDCVMFETYNQGVLPFTTMTFGVADNLTFPYFVDRSGRTSFGTELGLKPTCSNIGMIEFAGCSQGCSLRVRVRQVVEFTAAPGSAFAAFMEAALPPDPTALKMVMEIGARMADGYPAAYNDLGVLKNVITGIGKKVLPFVEPALDFMTKLPGPVGTIASVGKELVPVAKSVSAAVKKRKKSKTATPVAAAKTK